MKDTLLTVSNKVYHNYENHSPQHHSDHEHGYCPVRTIKGVALSQDYHNKNRIDLPQPLSPVDNLCMNKEFDEMCNDGYNECDDSMEVSQMDMRSQHSTSAVCSEEISDVSDMEVKFLIYI